LAATARPGTLGAVDNRPWEFQAQPTGTIAVEHEAGGTVLYLRGDVDAPVVQQWESEHSIDRKQIAAIDVSEMAYIDSIGLSFLVRWSQERSSAGQPAVIRRPRARFEQVMYIAGIGSLFVYED
jgi:anti-anti-sigma factor